MKGSKVGKTVYWLGTDTFRIGEVVKETPTFFTVEAAGKNENGFDDPWRLKHRKADYEEGRHGVFFDLDTFQDTARKHFALHIESLENGKEWAKEVFDEKIATLQESLRKSKAELVQINKLK